MDNPTVIAIDIEARRAMGELVTRVGLKDPHAHPGSPLGDRFLWALGLGMYYYWPTPGEPHKHIDSWNVGFYPRGEQFGQPTVRTEGSLLTGVVVLAVTALEDRGSPVPPPFLGLSARMLLGGHAEVRRP